MLSRILVLIYGLVAYLVGVAGLLAIIFSLAGILPFGFLRAPAAQISQPWLHNAALMIGWGVIHSWMARDGFKQAITQWIPDAAERPTYVLIAGITSVALTGFWQPLPGMLWSFSATPMVIGIWGLFAFGWVFLLTSTFMINHFDLFGLRQVYLNFVQQEITPLPFVKRAMYKTIRHPIQTGVLIGVWATPTMSVTHVFFSIGFTAYIFIGLWFEERDLIAEFGDRYREYMGETGKVFPKMKK